MLNYEHIKQNISQLNTPHIKIIDMKGKRIWDYSCSNVNETLAELEKNLNWLNSYGRVTIMAATDSMKNQNWKECYHWEAHFNASAPIVLNNEANNNTLPLKGFVSQNEASLMATIQALQMQMKYDKELAELKEQMQLMQNQKFDPMQLMPLAGLFLNIDEKKVSSMLSLYNMGQMVNGKNIGIAGTETNTKLSLETINNNSMNEDQLIKEIQKELELLSQKVPLETIYKLIQGLVKKPEMATTALNFL